MFLWTLNEKRIKITFCNLTCGTWTCTSDVLIHLSHQQPFTGIPWKIRLWKEAIPEILYNFFDCFQFPFQNLISKFSNFHCLYICFFCHLFINLEQNRYVLIFTERIFCTKWKFRIPRRLTCHPWQLFKIFTYKCRKIPLKITLLLSYTKQVPKSVPKGVKEIIVIKFLLTQQIPLAIQFSDFTASLKKSWLAQLCKNVL